MTETSLQAQLYDRDFNLWIEDTVVKLKAQAFDQLDLENLIEEVESLAGRDRRELESRLRVLLSHLLKRGYVPSPNDFRGWEVTIRDQRSELQLLLKQSPSLKPYLLEVFDESWRYALSIVREDYPLVSFPDVYLFPHDVEKLLSERFWEHE
ncbi:MAG: DUF29 domain-containing protein [Cyanobacteria bacterium CRU_2_1]|nr:DUF29 domain-containing protein [Cyanobacteria bacterium RU_5_0]NJR59203.1 DUF29 domain-containing protein [Cyanobacteria bacterium CRU_2_1]